MGRWAGWERDLRRIDEIGIGDWGNGRKWVGFNYARLTWDAWDGCVEKQLGRGSRGGRRRHRTGGFHWSH